MIRQLDLPERVQQLLSTYARETGQSENDVITEAILRHLEDVEDLRDAREVIQNPGERWTLLEVERDLGLEG